MKHFLKGLIFVVICFLLTAATIAISRSDTNLIEKSKKALEQYEKVYVDQEGNIISLYEYHGKSELLEKLKPILSLSEKTSLPIYLAIPPRKMDILPLPSDIDLKPHKELYSLAEKRCKKSNITYINLLKPLEENPSYLATDHHWTSFGAYIAYTEIIDVLGEKPIEEDCFKKELVNTSYRGSDYNKLTKKDSYSGYDTLELYYSENYPSYTTTFVSYPYNTEENNTVLQGFYDLSKARSYDVYLRGNNPYITIRNGEKRETLLIIRDSFASAIAPFLAEHFDLILIDTRFFPERLSTLCEKENVSAILILENMGSYTENKISINW